ERFPKFIIGFIVTFVACLYLVLGTPADIAAKVPAAIGEANTFRVIFFILTFFSIGVLSNFKRLWAEGIGKLAAVYFVSLFGFVIWVGLLISWLFFAASSRRWSADQGENHDAFRISRRAAPRREGAIA